MMKIYFAIFSITCLFLSCHKIETPEPELHQFLFDQNTKDYCIFNRGSWWRYMNQANGDVQYVIIDSVRNKTLIYNESIDGQSKDVLKAEYCNMIVTINPQFSDQSENIIYSDWRNGNPSLFGYKEEHVNWFIIWETLFDCNYTFYSTNDKNIIYKPEEGYEIKLSEVLSTYSIGNKVYNDVRVFTANKGYREGFQKKIYWARHIGKIRFETDSAVWNLTDFDVGQ